MRLFAPWRSMRWRPTRRDAACLAAGALLAVVVLGIGRLIWPKPTPLAYRPGGIVASWIPDTVTHWSGTIDQMAKRYNIDPTLLAILMTMESGGGAQAKSPDDAMGLMQVTPLTAQDIASKYLKHPVAAYQLTDPATNIEFGAAYLAYLRDLFGKPAQGPDWTATVELVAAGYNGGPGAAYNLEHGHGLEDTQTVVYSRDAFNMWRERHAADSPTFDRWKERGGTVLLEAAKASQR